MKWIIITIWGVATFGTVHSQVEAPAPKEFNLNRYLILDGSLEEILTQNSEYFPRGFEPTLEEFFLRLLGVDWKLVKLINSDIIMGATYHRFRISAKVDLIAGGVRRSSDGQVKLTEFSFIPSSIPENDIIQIPPRSSRNRTIIKKPRDK